jgi:hypothetical protein
MTYSDYKFIDVFLILSKLKSFFLIILGADYVFSLYRVIFNLILPFLYRLCGLVVRVLGFRTEMSCVSCEVRTEFIYVM